MSEWIPLSRPNITEEDRRAVAQVLLTDTLSRGPSLARFEHDFATYLGVRQAVAVSSGTQALVLALRALNLGPGMRVALPSFTFAAVINAVWSVGATPLLVDNDLETWNMRLDGLDGRADAVIAVHNFGLPLDMRLLNGLSLDVIEDACEALGAHHNSLLAGTRGRCGVFGFYPNKPLTTGEGGMFVTSEAELASRVRCLVNQGRDPAGGWLDQVDWGYSCRMSEMQASLGQSQLTCLDSRLAQRRDVACQYRQLLEGDSRFGLPPTADYLACSWFTFPVLLTRHDRDQVADELWQLGIQTGRYFPPLHQQPVFRKYGGEQLGTLHVSEQMGRTCLCLPLYPDLRHDQVKRVVEALHHACK